uniref:Uncharacterized protein n=1 Tax=Cucumis melo TaxID=3656 RepID=A0A9I9EIU3_CUCME
MVGCLYVHIGAVLSMCELRLAACFLVDWITCELSLDRMLSMLSWLDWIGWIGLDGGCYRGGCLAMVGLDTGLLALLMVVNQRPSVDLTLVISRRSPLFLYVYSKFLHHGVVRCDESERGKHRTGSDIKLGLKPNHNPPSMFSLRFRFSNLQSRPFSVSESPDNHRWCYGKHSRSL